MAAEDRSGFGGVSVGDRSEVAETHPDLELGLSATAARREPSTDLAWDVVLYALSAIVALVAWLIADAPLDRWWGRLAAPTYAAGVLVAWLQLRRRASLRARALLAITLFSAVVILPLAIDSDVRLSEGSRAHAKSDVLVIEQGAAQLMHGHDPYGATFEGPLASWPEWARTHVPYLPSMLVFGIPRALAGPTSWTDARVLCLATTLAITGSALVFSGVAGPARLRIFQVMLVLASGAALSFTSGKELPVLALLLASLVAFDRDRFLIAGTAAGLAASAHQFSWILLPFLVLGRREGTTNRTRLLTMAASLTVMIVAVAPFIAWDPKALIEDTVGYPLGVGQPTGGLSFTPGGLLMAASADARWLLVVGCGAALAVAGIFLARRAPTLDAAGMASGAGILLLVVLLLGPRVRVAYFVFPLNLLLWGRLLRPDTSPGRSAKGSAISKADPGAPRSPWPTERPLPASSGRTEQTQPNHGRERCAGC